MFGRKKEEVQEMTVHTAQQGKKGNVKEYLDSMSYLSRFVIEKKEALVEEEMKAIREIDKVKDSYTEVIEHNAAVSDKLNAEWMILFFFINRSPCCVRCGQVGAALPDFFDPARCKNPAAKRLRSLAPAESSLRAAGRHGAKNSDRCTR